MSTPLATTRPSAIPEWIGTREQLRWLYGISASILLLNLLDAGFTLYWVWSGRAKEANPLLSWAVLEYPLTFVLVKMALVSGGLFLLWRHRERPLAVIAMFLAFLTYYWLLTLHVGAIRIIL